MEKKGGKMARVVVRSTTIVGAEKMDEDEASRVKKIHLTPWDLIFLKDEYPQRGLIFPKPHPGIDLISSLKASLSVALGIFYPLAGRLVRVENDDDTASFYIDCDGSGGVRFVHAVAETVSVRDVLEPADGPVPDLIEPFFPANGVKSYQAVSEPFLAVQVTELKDGVFFSRAMNHLVVDGSSASRFFHCWSKICSSGLGSDHRKNFPPLAVKSWFLDGIDYPIHVPLSETQTCGGPWASPSLQQKIFHFSKENIWKLKAKANEEAGSCDHKISSLQAVVGHMWWSIIKQGDWGGEEDVHCKLAVDIRQRLNPPVERECFGNMIAFGTVTTTAGELLEHGPAWAALQINKMVRSQTNESIRMYARNWVNNIKIQDPREQSGTTCNSLLVGGSPRFDEYQADFGWGKPIAVRAKQGIALNGEIALLPGAEEATIDAHLWLSSQLLVQLLADSEFLENVTLV